MQLELAVYSPVNCLLNNLISSCGIMKFILLLFCYKWTHLFLLDDFTKNKGKGSNLNCKFLTTSNMKWIFKDEQ